MSKESLWRNHRFCFFLLSYLTLYQARELPLCHLGSVYDRYREETSCQVIRTRVLCAILSSKVSYHDRIDLHCCVLSRPPQAWFCFPYFSLCRFEQWECLWFTLDVSAALASIRSYLLLNQRTSLCVMLVILLNFYRCRFLRNPQEGLESF